MVKNFFRYSGYRYYISKISVRYNNALTSNSSIKSAFKSRKNTPLYRLVLQVPLHYNGITLGIYSQNRGKLTDFQFSSIKIMCNTSHIFTAMCNFPCDGQRPMFTRKGIGTPPQWRVGVYGSTAVAGGMVCPKFGGSTATLVGRVCDLLVDSFLLLMSYQMF